MYCIYCNGSAGRRGQYHSLRYSQGHTTKHIYSVLLEAYECKGYWMVPIGSFIYRPVYGIVCTLSPQPNVQPFTM